MSSRGPEFVNRAFFCDPCYLSNVLVYGMVGGLTLWPSSSSSGFSFPPLLRGSLSFGLGMAGTEYLLRHEQPPLMAAAGGFFASESVTFFLRSQPVPSPLYGLSYLIGRASVPAIRFALFDLFMPDSDDEMQMDPRAAAGLVGAASGVLTSVAAGLIVHRAKAPLGALVLHGATFGAAMCIYESLKVRANLPTLTQGRVWRNAAAKES